jgi:hypothetical protein
MPQYPPTPRLTHKCIQLLLYCTLHQISGSLVQKHLCLVDLRRQVGASAAIGVVLHDHLAMSLADDLLVETTFPAVHPLVNVHAAQSYSVTTTYEHSRISAASLLFIVFSNPPL